MPPMVRSQRAGSTRWPGLEPWVEDRRDQFGLLLALLVAAFLLTGINTYLWMRVAGAGLNLAAVGAGLLASGVRLGRFRFALVAFVGVAGMVLLAVFRFTTLGGAIGALCQVAVLGMVLFVVIRRVLTMDRVTLPAIIGAVAGYFLIGLIFAWVYVAHRGLVDRPILDPPERDVPVYFSFVVLTTLGFGDVTPVNELTRRITVMEAMVGQVFLVTLVARLVSMFGASPRSGVGTD